MRSIASESVPKNQRTSDFLELLDRNLVVPSSTLFNYPAAATKDSAIRNSMTRR